MGTSFHEGCGDMGFAFGCIGIAACPSSHSSHKGILSGDIGTLSGNIGSGSGSTFGSDGGGDGGGGGSSPRLRDRQALVLLLLISK